jgi:hypothetical protein
MPFGILTIPYSISSAEPIEVVCRRPLMSLYAVFMLHSVFGSCTV